MCYGPQFASGSELIIGYCKNSLVLFLSMQAPMSIQAPLTSYLNRMDADLYQQQIKMQQMMLQVNLTFCTGFNNNTATVWWWYTDILALYLIIHQKRLKEVD